MLMLNLYFSFPWASHMVLAQPDCTITAFISHVPAAPSQAVCIRLSYFLWDIGGLWGDPISSTPISTEFWTNWEIKGGQAKPKYHVYYWSWMSWLESQIDLIIGSSVRPTDPLGRGQGWIGAGEPHLGGGSKIRCQLPRGRRMELNWACLVSSSSVYVPCNSLHYLWVKGQREARRGTHGAPFPWK